MSILASLLNKAGLSLSMYKSKVFILKNTQWEVRADISRISRFHITIGLGKYLGILLLHKRMSFSTFSF